jgi:membrane protease YdiL (CAAX protease family)
MTRAQRLAGYDLALLIGLGALINYASYQYSAAYAGPLTAFILLLIVAALSRWRSVSAQDLGLVRPARLRWLPVQVLIILVTTVVVGALTHKIALLVFAAPAPQQRFAGMAGNLSMFLQWLLIGWVVGGFAEEVIFRGFLLSRFEALLGNIRFATMLAVLFQATVFGVIHFYNRGMVGATSIFMVAVVMGVFYLYFKRSLLPLILAHGLVDSLSFLEDYLGV